jgi:hypothetical protein
VTGSRNVANIGWAWKAIIAVLVSLPLPVLGDAPKVTTLLPGAPVRIEKLTGAIYLLEDVDGKLDIAAVSTAPANTGFVVATPKSSNVGFSPSAWWVRITLRNPSDESRLVYLRQDYPLIDLLDLFEPNADGWRVHSTGDRKPFGSRDVEHRDFLFPLTLPAATERTYYLRFASQGPVDINLSLLDPSELAAELSREQLAYGVYFGCVIMLMVWSGLVFLAVRDGAFLAYFAYVASFGLYMTINTGFAFQYLWPDSPRWANTSLIVLLNIALIAALQFSLTILRARDYTPRLFRAARVLQAIALVAICLSSVLAVRGYWSGRHSPDPRVGVFHDCPGHDQPVGGLETGALLRHRLGRLPLRFRRLPPQELRAGAAHLHDAAQLADRCTARNDPAVDDAVQPHERTQESEPHRFAHAARKPARVRRDVAGRIRSARAKRTSRCRCWWSTSISSSSTTTFTVTRKAMKRSRPWRRLCASTRASPTLPVATAAMSSAPSCPARTKHWRRCLPSVCARPCKAP